MLHLNSELDYIAYLILYYIFKLHENSGMHGKVINKKCV